jgi:hypothetical protein
LPLTNGYGSVAGRRQTIDIGNGCLGEGREASEYDEYNHYPS